MNPAASMDVYLELVNLSDIAEFIQQNLVGSDSIPVIPDEVLEHADFGHSMEGLEITVNKESEIPQAELKIAQFMNKHEWFFETKGVVFGKLSAYISKFNRHQWEFMERSGILKQKLFPERLEDVVRRNEMEKAKSL
ncbi:301_t:CDS:2 [Ambispora leptoticha]|uniref:301_t:CDS:1 n=1 Tax=Ambispora leptoticha TaxID=144679 RepID=A0A9N9B998_9GLOM|nr:301_t:CDS:2 [Ambispora leptoticha]